jgi:hypothetical protein
MGIAPVRLLVVFVKGVVFMDALNLGSYVANVRAIREEWLESVTDEHVARLRTQFSGVPVSNWYKWRRDNASLITAFSSHTPRQSAKLKKFQADWPLLVWAVVQMCDEALALLSPLASQCLCELPLGYRDMIGSASSLYADVLLADIEDWPFADDSPFGE